MSEIINGTEALRQLPLRDVILPKAEAMNTLTANTKIAVQANIDFILGNQNSHDDYSVGFNKILEGIKEDLAPGGLSLVEKEYDCLLSKYGNITYLQLATMFFNILPPNRWNSFTPDTYTYLI